MLVFVVFRNVYLADPPDGTIPIDLCQYTYFEPPV
jgi:hypothetical protein